MIGTVVVKTAAATAAMMIPTVVSLLGEKAGTSRGLFDRSESVFVSRKVTL